MRLKGLILILLSGLNSTSEVLGAMAPSLRSAVGSGVGDAPYPVAAMLPAMKSFLARFLRKSSPTSSACLHVCRQRTVRAHCRAGSWIKHATRTQIYASPVENRLADTGGCGHCWIDFAEARGRGGWNCCITGDRNLVPGRDPKLDMRLEINFLRAIRRVLDPKFALASRSFDIDRARARIASCECDGQARCRPM